MRHTLQPGPTDLSSVLRVPVWLADDYLESYICWREECASVRGAYERWGAVERTNRPLAFAAYHAALDREEQAARALRENVERVRRWQV